MKGLRFFQRTSQKGAWSLAYFHSPHSLTWRWSLGLRLFRGDEWRVLPLFGGYRPNSGLLQWWFRIPFVGMVDFHQQRPMWYRNLYMRMRDEKDQLDGMLWLNDRHPHKVCMPPPPPPLPTNDGTATVQ